MSVNVGVFGLGSMGFGMAKSCPAAGLVTYGLDVVADSVAHFLAEGGQTGALADIAPLLDTVVVGVLSGPQVEEVSFGGNGVVQSHAALEGLRSQGGTQFFFKCCSTCQSTPEGNIGPETDPGAPSSRAGPAPAIARISGNFGAEDFFEKADKVLAT
ncbi:MAG: NAD(P)-binding domain-containing protein [Pseudomonadota bacterium]